MKKMDEELIKLDIRNKTFIRMMTSSMERITPEVTDGDGIALTGPRTINFGMGNGNMIHIDYYSNR